MKYILTTGIFLTSAILFTASSGILKAEAYPDYETNRNYQEDDLYKYGEKDLYGLDKELLEGIDKEALLNTALNLLKGLDVNALNEALLQGSGDASGFVLILVLFILLVIVGAGFSGYGGG